LLRAASQCFVRSDQYLTNLKGGGASLLRAASQCFILSDQYLTNLKGGGASLLRELRMGSRPGLAGSAQAGRKRAKEGARQPLPQGRGIGWVGRPV